MSRVGLLDDVPGLARALAASGLPTDQTPIGTAVVANPLVTVSIYELQPLGIDPRGVVTTYAYDDLGRQTRATRNDVAGSSSNGDEDLADQTWYDALGRETETIVHCTDSGRTPTPSPTGCTGGGTHDAATNVVAVPSGILAAVGSAMVRRSLHQ